MQSIILTNTNLTTKIRFFLIKNIFPFRIIKYFKIFLVHYFFAVKQLNKYRYPYPTFFAFLEGVFQLVRYSSQSFNHRLLNNFKNISTQRIQFEKLNHFFKTLWSSDEIISIIEEMLFSRRNQLFSRRNQLFSSSSVKKLLPSKQWVQIWHLGRPIALTRVSSLLNFKESRFRRRAISSTIRVYSGLSVTV